MLSVAYAFTGYVFLHHARDRLLVSRAHHTFDFLTVTEKNQGGNSLDAVTLGSRGIIVDVQLHDTRVVAIVLGHGRYRRRKHAARGTPFSPKIQQHGLVGAQYLLLKRTITHFF